MAVAPGARMGERRDLLITLFLIALVGLFLIGDGIVGVITRRMHYKITLVGADAVNTGFIHICGGAIFVYAAYKLWRWNTDDDE